MSAPTLHDLLALDLSTRLALVQELWDSIVRDAQTGSELPISDADKSVLDERLREDDDDPHAVVAWSDARARLRQQR